MTRVIKHFPTHRLCAFHSVPPGHCPLQSVEEQVTLLKGDLEEEEEVYTDWSTDWVQSSRPHSYRDSLGTHGMQMFGGSSSHEEEAKD